MSRNKPRPSPALLLLLLAALITVVRAEVMLARNFVGEDFENDFTFFTKDDPTHGTVNYVNKQVGKTLGIVESTNNYFRMAVDTKSAKATGRGRNSIRIVSKDEFADGVYILDVDHMPVGCGTWPAFWTTVMHGWPKGGEIDIIEGANALPLEQSSAWAATFANTPANLSGITQVYTDTASLHTIATCNIENDGLQSGKQVSRTCDVRANNNQGCGVELGGATWGNGWNAADGGYYVMWRDFQASGRIYVWAFPRRLSGIPAEVTDSSATKIDPASWTFQPMANFSIPQCSKKTFGNHHIIFNIALCGDLAGNTYASSGCPGMCSDFVINTPGAFADAWWGIRALRIYTSDGKLPSSGMPRWKAAVIAVVVIAGVGLATFGIIFCIRRRRRNNKINAFHRTEMLATPASRSSTAGRFNAPYAHTYTDSLEPDMIFNPEGAARRRSSIVPFVDVPVTESQSSTRRPSNSSQFPPAFNRNSMLSAKSASASAKASPDGSRRHSRVDQSPIALGPELGKTKLSRKDKLRDPRVPDVLKVGDGGSVWRSPDAPLPGETKAAPGMTQWNAAGSGRRSSVGSSMRRGSIDPTDVRRMSKSRAVDGGSAPGSIRGAGGAVPATPTTSNRGSIAMGFNNPFNSPLANTFPEEDGPSGPSGGGGRGSVPRRRGSTGGSSFESVGGPLDRGLGRQGEVEEGDGWDSWDEDKRR